MVSIYTLDAELLEELKPDLVLTQGLCDVCAVSLGDFEHATAGLSEKPRVLSTNQTSLGEMLDTTVEVGKAIGYGAEAHEKVASLRERLAPVAKRRRQGFPGHMVAA